MGHEEAKRAQGRSGMAPTGAQSGAGISQRSYSRTRVRFVDVFVGRSVVQSDAQDARPVCKGTHTRVRVSPRGPACKGLSTRACLQGPANEGLSTMACLPRGVHLKMSSYRS